MPHNNQHYGNGNGRTDRDGQWTTIEVDGYNLRRRSWTMMELAMEEQTATTMDGGDDGNGRADGDKD